MLITRQGHKRIAVQRGKHETLQIKDEIGFFFHLLRALRKQYPTAIWAPTSECPAGIAPAVRNADGTRYIYDQDRHLRDAAAEYNDGQEIFLTILCT